jgi:hypothetical protein
MNKGDIFTKLLGVDMRIQEVELMWSDKSYMYYEIMSNLYKEKSELMKKIELEKCE